MAIIAGVAIFATVIVSVLYFTPVQRVASYSSGNISVHVLEDSSRKFLAEVENNGPALDNSAAFAVKKGLNGDCEPQGVVVSNFKVENDNGNLSPNPDSIPANGKVTIDSASANLNNIPPSTETTVYILQLEPGSIRAAGVLYTIPIQQSNSTELKQYEECLAGGGYPLLFRLTGLQKGSQAYLTVDGGDGEKYETSFSIAQNAPDLAAVYCPDSEQNWLKGNFTQQSGPAPLWQEQQTLQITAKTAIAGHIEQFEAQVVPELRTASLDFVEVAKGNAVPVYPKYWEVRIDLEQRTISIHIG
jgi:hypothetical protein